MQTISIEQAILTGGAKIISREGEETKLLWPALGGGLNLPQLIHCKERYGVFTLECREDHSMNMYLNVRLQNAQQQAPHFDLCFGVMPGVKTLICLDLRLMDASVLFPETTPGQRKITCHGGRVDFENVASITLENAPSFQPVEAIISDILLTDQRPEEFPLPRMKLIDEMGQYKLKDWAGKSHSIGDMRLKLQEALQLPDAFGMADWDAFGGLKTLPVCEATGFFKKAKVEGKWFLADPLGNAFFSIGPDCVVARSDCRIDGLEALCDWLPAENDSIYGPMFAHMPWPHSGDRRRDCTLFSFEQANLYKAFGEDWYQQWQRLMCGQLKQNGLNTLGNWSDENIKGKMSIPYVTTLKQFPGTKQCIFRDFPDVLSGEYLENAHQCAQLLKDQAHDPLMIGYFLRNEPAWAFVNNLVIADEVLYNQEPSACKRELIRTLQAQYGEISKLNSAWGTAFAAFEDLNRPIKNASMLSEKANKDLRAFSRVMLEAYVGIPSEACRKVDPNHMNLGMRWAWISDPDLVTGWEHFDVFSINCYAVDPTPAIDRVAELGVDLPVMIGEFHFGALDGGQTATGLEGVTDQTQRGIAYRHYVEQVAAHPAGVGCHWFQCYDQFELGRFDGENYNIGLFDVCSLPSPIMMNAVRRTSESVYAVKAGITAPTEKKPQSIPMVSY